MNVFLKGGQRCNKVLRIQVNITWPARTGRLNSRGNKTGGWMREVISKREQAEGGRCFDIRALPLLSSQFLHHSTLFHHLILLCFFYFFLTSYSCVFPPQVILFAPVVFAPQRDRPFTRLFVFILIFSFCLHQSLTPFLSSFHFLLLSLDQTVALSHFPPWLWCLLFFFFTSSVLHSGVVRS